MAITAKFAALQAEAGILQGRVEGLERTLPQRIQMVENRQVTFVETLNAMTAAINQKIEQVEHFVLAQPKAAAPPQTFPPIPQSYGGPQPSQPTMPEQFQLGSPLSAPPGMGANPSSAPTPDPWASYHATYVAGSQAAPPMAPPVAAASAAGQEIIQHWDERRWDISHAKVSKELKPFNGSDSAYRTWAGRVRDHFKEVNRDWALVFAEIEKQQTVIPMNSQTLCYLFAPGRQVQVDFAWVTNVLWTFLGKHIVDSMYGHRSAVASGPDNGVELWRAYFVKHEGGADQVELGGIDSLHTFPQCQKVEDLGFWLGKWIEMKDQYGQGMSDVHLRSRFLNILPEAVKKDVRETRGLHTLQDMIQHVQKDLGRLNDSKIAKLHADRLRQSLSGTHRVNAMTEVEDPTPPTHGPKSEDEITQFQDMINALSSKIDTIAAAVDTKRTQPRGGPHAQRAARPERGPSDFSKFKGCLHCGGDHRVADCRIKKALLAKNGGKLPAGFKSAFDKWKAAQPAKKVAALSDAELQDEDLQSESDFAWGITCGALTAKQVCTPCDFRHTNSFANIFEDDSYDDEEDGEEHILSTLQQMTSNVSVGPKVSQRQRKDPSQRQPIDRRTVAAIAKRVRNGDYNLPDLQLESNDQYEAVWALVDSGAGRSCARRSQHFGHTKTELKPSSVKMATASGEELKSRGCFTIDLLSTEGNTLHQTFEDADVDMPILSVTELSTNGAMGSDVMFRKSDGAIIDLQTSAASRFVKRRGVYFMKVYTLRNRKAGFSRPGAA